MDARDILRDGERRAGRALSLVLAGILAFVGLKNVKQVKAPQKTIDSTKELKNLVPGKAQKSLDRKTTHGLYT